LGQVDAALAQPVLMDSFATWSELGERRHLAFANGDLGAAAVWQKDFALAACASVRRTRSNSAWPHDCPRRRSSTSAQSAKFVSSVSSAVTNAEYSCAALAPADHAHTVRKPWLLPT